MDSRFCQCRRSTASSSASLQLTPLACRSSRSVDRQVFLGRHFSAIGCCPVYLHSELGILVPSGGCVLQTGVFSLLLCLVVASVQYVQYLRVRYLVLLGNSDDLSVSSIHGTCPTFSASFWYFSVFHWHIWLLIWPRLYIIAV